MSEEMVITTSDNINKENTWEVRTVGKNAKIISREVAPKIAIMIPSRKIRAKKCSLIERLFHNSLCIK